jgi:hypothetical protein
MNLIQAFAAAATLFAFAAAQATPQEVVKLPRVVITGKSVQAEQKVVVQLPRVVVTGLSINSQLQQQTLAAAKPARRI